MAKTLLIVCGFSLLLLSWGTARAGAQTVAAGPYYATPAWDQKLVCSAPANCPRFVVLSNWNNEAVLDRETGIVWEKSPNLSPFDEPTTLDNAAFQCARKPVGGRKGWRLSTVEELQSLVDLSAPNIALPPGHPFIGVKTAQTYWAVTRIPAAVGDVGYQVGFAPGGLLFGTSPFSNLLFYWCVRGPGGATQ